MRRRDFIRGIAGSAAAWPLIARAQQSPMPVIGFLGSVAPQLYEIRLDAFRQGLKELGYVEGQNVAIDYRWPEGQSDRLPVVAAQLAERRVNVIVAGGGTASATAAKAATSTIPVVFEVAVDPVEIGLVASLDRPGGNITGVTNLNAEVGAKRLELLHELLPAVNVVGVLVNPANVALSEPFTRIMESAADRLGMQLHVLNASAERDFEPAFAALDRLRAGALVIGPDVFFNSRSEQLAELALRHSIPAAYDQRSFVAAGGLLSYGGDEADAYRLVGLYAARILKGDKPADLPVMRSTKVQLFINLKTAKVLGITVPIPVLGRADEVIE
jgi:putative ABC transport system substrate-binding protein